MTICSVMAKASVNVVRERAVMDGREERARTRRVHTKEKLNGVHYTPPDLALYLAAQVVEGLKDIERTQQLIRVLDPACGDGGLLRALAQSIPSRLRLRLVLHGYDTDEVALGRARQNLSPLGVHAVTLRCADYLAATPSNYGKSQMNLAFPNGHVQTSNAEGEFDAVISNPPYVRTQVLGAERARQLAVRFELTGRVDLYHAFVKAMTLALREGGIIGLLTSNRFLSIRSGEATRYWLLRQFRLRRLVDLGDTKLFSAAVLPAVLVGERHRGEKPESCEFIRVYEDPNGVHDVARKFGSVLDALDGTFHGVASVNGVHFRVEAGHLQAATDCRLPWSIATDQTAGWLETVKRHSAGQFSDFGKVSVGIKTTADAVFIRDDWETLPG